MNPLFVTFYDPWPVGIRGLMGISNSLGITSPLVSFHGFEMHAVKKRSKVSTYEYYNDDTLMRTSLPPITEDMIDTVINHFPDHDLLCVSIRSFGMDIVHKFADTYRRKSLNPIIAGGWGPMMEPEQALQWASYVCFGEGDRTWRDILKQGLHRDLKNVMYLDNGKIIRNPCYPLLTVQELDDTPFQDLKNSYLFDNKGFKSNFPASVCQLFSGRGCPMSCSYCMSGQLAIYYKNMYGLKCSKYRLASAGRLFKELKYANDDCPLTVVRIKDEVFPWDKKWLEEFIDRYPKEIGVRFFGYLRPEFHSRIVIDKLIDIGLKRSCVGIQSGSERILKLYNRPMKLDTARELAELFAKGGVRFPYHFISHNPFETEEDQIKTLKYIWTLPYGKCTIFKYLNLPKSPLSDRIEKENPVGLPGNILEWYAFLWAIAILGKYRRIATKIIFKLSLFKNTPDVLIKLYHGLKKVKKKLCDGRKEQP